MKRYIYALVATLAAMGTLFAQTKQGITVVPTNLPDISVIGNFQASTVKNNPDKTGFSLKEIELAIQGYLYPDIRSDVFIGLHKEDGKTEVHLEEAYLTFSTLTEGVGAKLGKKLLSVGKQNVLHPEQWAWIEKPSVVTHFLGEEGTAAEGVSLDWLVPAPFFLQLDVGVWQQTAGHTHEEGESEPAFVWSDWLTHARLWSSVAPVDTMEFELGVSYLMGKGPEFKEEKDDAMLLGVDMTYRIWDGVARWIVQGEVFSLNRVVDDTAFNRFGGYGYLGYRPDRYWDYGVRIDHSQSAALAAVTTRTISLLGTYQLTETSKMRVQYSHDLVADNHGVYAQMVFGMGPHSHVLQ